MIFLSMYSVIRSGVSMESSWISMPKEMFSGNVRACNSGKIKSMSWFSMRWIWVYFGIFLD